jgi:hypothetical protein
MLEFVIIADILADLGQVIGFVGPGCSSACFPRNDVTHFKIPRCSVDLFHFLRDRRSLFSFIPHCTPARFFRVCHCPCWVRIVLFRFLDANTMVCYIRRKSKRVFLHSARVKLQILDTRTTRLTGVICSLRLHRSVSAIPQIEPSNDILLMILAVLPTDGHLNPYSRLEKCDRDQGLLSECRQEPGNFIIRRCRPRKEAATVARECRSTRIDSVRVAAVARLRHDQLLS